ncbi:EamA family transporter [Pseudoflavonifractor sp. 60]|nr:EamA family transporter [Pseudoflavonifractor sp. 60]
MRSASEEAGESEVVPRKYALCPVFGQRAFCKGVIVLSARQRGTLCVFLAAVLYSIGGLCIKLIPWGGMAINGARTAIALVVIGAYLKTTHHKPRMNLWILVGALSVCGTNILFSIANKLTTAANTIVLQFTAPIFVILFSVLLFGKKPQKLDLLACGLVLGGVLLFFVDSLSAGGMLGNILALLSGVSYAGVFLMNDMPDCDPISSVFWGDVISAVVGLPFLGYETSFSVTTLISLLVLGVFQVGLAYILMVEGLKTTPPVTASLVSGIEPVLNPILVAVFYHEMIGPVALVGAMVVVGSVVLYNVILARQTNPFEAGEIR